MSFNIPTDHLVPAAGVEGGPASRATAGGFWDLAPELLKGLTPACNTGVYDTERESRQASDRPGDGFIRMLPHWVRVAGESYGKCKSVIERLFQFSDWVPGKGGLGFREKRICGPHGISLSFDQGEDGPCNAFLEVPGQACDVLGGQAFYLMRCFRPECITRVDLAFDGWQVEGQDVSPRWIYDKVGEHHDFIRSLIDRDKVRLVRDGYSGKRDTVYLGSRSSERFLCCYNERGFCRFELRLSGRYSRALAEMLRAGLNTRAAAFGFLRDFLEFVEPGSSNINRAPLQAWWSAVVERWDLAEVPAPQVSKSLDKSWSWLVRQVSAVLATVASAVSIETIVETLLTEGLDRMGARHHQLLASSPGWSPPLVQ